ncbi:tRNA pseudouridine(55) synthase TruB [Ahrensia sp. R2A130]|uniref:tRNA pseudouridine(55) synthase TruB n=1 Tax=Ahrensia sp. R2A130 TaxID=744979 RepID=UPI0001E0BC65|nr:tRNA pseudouridine(55) synthase TruB [Ahrensia sp. R2A130]EFL89761.1 tRNA pseudouridine synthase B [Ahrensia sp. R2A130]
MGRRKKGRAVSGWLVLDKPLEMGSTQAVGKLRWLFDAQKAGHAGTLDPLATGVLPIAFGEATKTMPYVTDGQKAYRFTVRWGSSTNTDDAEGEITASSDERPTRNDIEALLPSFTGTIEQVPPAFSAIKIDGKRAYAEARAGREVELAARPVEIDTFELVDIPDDTHAVFEVTCGKGTYVRALARDMGARLGCHGHIRDLRRTFVEPFEEEDAIPLSELLELEGDLAALDEHLISPLEAMDGFPEIKLSSDEARRVGLGNSIILRGRDAPVEEQDVCAIHRGDLIAIGNIEKGSFQPRRVLVQN